MADDSQSVLGAAQQAAGNQSTSVLDAASSAVSDGNDSFLKAADKAANPIQPKASLMGAVNTFLGQTFTQPPGQTGAVEDVIKSQSARGRNPLELIYALHRASALAFPNISQQQPTTAELNNYAASNKDFADTMAKLDQQRLQSYQLAKATHGDNPDWDKVESDFIDSVYKKVQAAWMAGARPSPDNPLPDPRNTNDMMDFAQRLAVPGQDRRPISDAEVADAAWGTLKASNAAEAEALPGWVKTGIKASAEGIKFGLLSRAGLEGAPLGVASEAANQAMGVASGEQKEFAPEQVLLSGLLMKGASAAGEAVKAVGGGASKQLGAQVGVFEAANLAAKGVQTMKGGAEAPEDEQRTWLEKLGNHILESVIMGGSAALAGPGGGADKELAAKAGKADFEATKITADALREKLSKIPGVSDLPPERIKARQRQVEEDIVPAVAAIEKAKTELQVKLEEVAPHDPELQKKLNDATRIVVQTDGKIPVPAVTVVPEAFHEVLDKQMALGEAGLGIGRVLEKYGALPYARYQQPGTTSDIIVGRGEEPPPGAKLVGGLDYAEQKGHYFPQVTAGEFTPEPTPQVRGFVQRGGMGTAEQPMVGEAAGHLQKRTQTFDEAFASRPLDLSFQKAYEVFMGESDLARRQAWLDLSHQQGDIVTKDQLPDAAARSNMQQRIDMIDKDVAKKRQELKLFSPEDQLGSKAEIATLLKEKIDLQAAMKQKLWKELKSPTGKGYGEYEDMWMHRDALARMGRAPQEESAIGATARLLRSTIKIANVGMNAALFLPYMIGNYLHLRTSIGVNELPEYLHSAGVNLGKSAKDALDYTYDALVRARRAAFGGPIDVTADDTRAIRKIDQRIAEYEAQEKGTNLLKVQRVLAQKYTALKSFNDWVANLPATPQLLMRIPQGAINGLMRLPVWRQAIDAQASSRASFRELVLRGTSGGSGPLSPGDAFDMVQSALDYRQLPNAVQKASNVLTFVRWPAKVIQATIANGMQQKPSMFGIELPTPMDRVIRENPGSPQAQIALVARGMLRLGMNMAEFVTPLMAAQRSAAAAQGISQKELDAALKEKFDYLPGPVAWLSRLGFLPTGRDVYGQIQGIDAGRMNPVIQAIRYFSYGFQPASPTSSPSNFLRDIAFQIADKNIFAGPIMRGIAGENMGGKPIEKGFGPGQSWWGAETAMMPAVISRPLEEYFHQQNVPEEERSVLRSVLKHLAGVPITVAPTPNFLEKEVDRLYREGVLGIDLKDNGAYSYYVKNPKSLEAMISHAQTIVTEFQKDNPDLARLQRRNYHAIQHAIEGIGQ